MRFFAICTISLCGWEVVKIDGDDGGFGLGGRWGGLVGVWLCLRAHELENGFLG